MRVCPQVLIIDFGSQTTALIARMFREQRVHAIVIEPDQLAVHWQSDVKLIVLSGGPSSVYEGDAPRLPDELRAKMNETSVGVLGICYGLQLLMNECGGEVRAAAKREFGAMQVRSIDTPNVSRFFPRDLGRTWMSHGDEVKRLAPGFHVMAKSQAGAIAVVEHESKNWAGVQFHPEVTQTEQRRELFAFWIQAFALVPNLDFSDWAQDQVSALQARIPKNAIIISALSGGVDSTVATVLLHRAFPGRVHSFLVDHGCLRKDEASEVKKLLGSIGLSLHVLEEQNVFMAALRGVVDPETKRKIMGREFVRAFEKGLREQLSRVDPLGESGPRYLVQGTLYPDVIESAHSSKSSAMIKTHHNVGGLPDDLGFQLIEPLRELFKDEVREIGAKLGISNDCLLRHPFPGPGLSVRILGELDLESIRILQEADAIFREELHLNGLYHSTWQAFAVLLPVKTVGVMGDKRTYERVCALRAVSSSDGMTAEPTKFPMEFLFHVASRVINEVQGINRVVYDISSKPPATIEWE